MNLVMTNPPKEKIRLWAERFEALSLRERGLFLISILAVMYITWDFLLMEQVRAEQKSAVIQMKKWHSQIADIDKRIQSTSAALSGNGQNQAMQQVERLKSEINDINQRQKALAVSFIRPRQMVDVLKGLLATEKGLQLTRLQSQVAQPLIHKTQEAKTDNSSIKKSLAAKGKLPEANNSEQAELENNANNASPLPEVYKHGLEIVFQGDYNSTLSYLRKLEQLPWKFYWEEVVYEVLDYPKAQIMVRIHTLSLDKGWISV